MAMDLSKQVGPLPLGAWIAVVAGGLGLAYYTWRQQNASGATSPQIVDDTGGQVGVGDGSVGGWSSTSPQTSDPSGTQTFTTNEQWATAAITWLIAQGYNPTTADSAIRKYIAGSFPAPSMQEWAMISLALAHFGPPPDTLPPGENEPPSTTPPPSQAPPPVVVGKPPPAVTPAPSGGGGWDFVTPWPAQESTLWGMAVAHYHDGNKWGVIFNANKTGVRRPDGSMGMISNPNLVRPGWKLWIPNA